MEIDLEAVAQDLVEVSAKRTIEEMGPEKRAAFDAAIAAKVDEYVASLTPDKLGALIGGNIAAAAMGHLRVIISRQIDKDSGVFARTLNDVVAIMFSEGEMRRTVVAQLAKKADAFLSKSARESVESFLAKKMYGVVDDLMKRGF